ncbi:MAG: choice-of-anchor tandem repeat NxxGxxAF-containing protein [Chthoniobacteraceae bacterium]
MIPSTIRQLTCLAVGVASLTTASAHIGYTNRNFGSFSGSDNKAVLISNQGISGASGWADATDEDWGDSHKGRYFRFTLLTAARVTIKVEASDDGGTKLGTLIPAFSLYSGLAHLSPAGADHDSSAISVAYLDSVPGTQEGVLRTLTNFDIGNDDAVAPYDFETQLTHFIYVGHAADGTSANFGTAPGIQGDGVQDGIVEKSFELPAGEYTLFVGGADYSLVDAGTYGAKVSVSVGPNPGSGVTPIAEPGQTGVPYKWTVNLGQDDEVELVTHVGAWSWEDDSLFNAANNEPPVGWTHTSVWAGITLSQPSHLTVLMEQQAGVSWPSVDNPTRTASTASMFPSFTIWQHWDEDGGQEHIYNNRGNVAWAEKLVFIGFVDNSTAPSVQRSFNLPAGKYTIVFGSNAAANDLDRQGFKATLSTAPMAQPVAITGGVVPGLPGVTFKTLGSPTMNDEEQVAFRATLSCADVRPGNDTAIFSDTGSSPLRLIVREGQVDAATGGKFGYLGDPITDNADNVLFFAKLRLGSGVNETNDCGVWRYVAAADSLQLIAREGTVAPGVEDGAAFRSFPSIVTDSAGGAFVAKLVIRGRVTEANDEGIWLFNDHGYMTLLAREGKRFTVAPGDVRIVRTLDFIEPKPTVKGVGRSTNAFGGRVLRLTFRDGTSGIFHLAP